MEVKPVAQLDMDGTVCDFDSEMIRRLNLLRSTEEPVIGPEYRDMKDIPFIRERVRLVMAEESFWDELPQLQIGYDILTELNKLDYDICVLTQGPRSNPHAWSRKVRWCEKNLPGYDVTVTRRKGQVYGRVLVDDYPSYVLSWLEHRPRGTVIMPVNYGNRAFSHPQVVKYDGSNIVEVRNALTNAKERRTHGEED
jgi:5'(3')-deoxyribonucleotidase